MNDQDSEELVTNYNGFPSFEEWGKIPFETSRWERYASRIAKFENQDPEILQRAQNVVRRAAAVDTGAIEGLYTVDSGFTFTVARETAMWEAALAEKGEKARALIESQLRTYVLISDPSFREYPITMAFIRRIHEELCESQDTYLVHTSAGDQEHLLALGKYKTEPNAVRRQDGTLHWYCSPEDVPSEMAKLSSELQSPGFLSSHPVLQASYAHYAIAEIHPFADGNGRVARALASNFLYSAYSIPLLVLNDNRDEYLYSLQAADEHNFEPFVKFVLERGLDAIKLVEESFRTALLPTPEAFTAQIRQLYFTSGGYTQEEVDQAGYTLFDLFEIEVLLQKKVIENSNIVCEVTPVRGGVEKTINSELRASVTQPSRLLRVLLTTVPPAAAKMVYLFQLEVPKDCGRDDDIVIHLVGDNDVFEVRVTEILPKPTESLRKRLSIFVERMFAFQLRNLVSLAAAQLASQK